MEQEKQRLIIPFIGLNEGIHRFEFKIDSPFFGQFDYSIIEKGEFKIKVEFEKKKNLFNLYFKLKGKITANCDRCLAPLTMKVKGEESLIVKFGETTYNETDEIKVISPAEYELDLAEDVYQFVHTLMPNKVKHEKKKDCDPKIIEQLEKLTTKKASTEVDPRWEGLSQFKDKSE
ncbi:MAG: DUF177 domain-containing protein [Vicingaceae bacterium]|tara:strand:- start:2782 stop:3306 length:525 start_codon:yes stop_codon:yes gene_type:complete